MSKKKTNFNKCFYEARFTDDGWVKEGWCFIAPKYFQEKFTKNILKSTVNGNMEFEEEGVARSPSVIFFDRDLASFNPFSLNNNNRSSSLQIEIKINKQWMIIESSKRFSGTYDSRSNEGIFTLRKSALDQADPYSLCNNPYSLCNNPNVGLTSTKVN